jgi:hypothetical protein
MGAVPPFDSSTSLSRHRATSRAMQPGPWDADAGDVQPSTARAPNTSWGACKMRSRLPGADDCPFFTHVTPCVH